MKDKRGLELTINTMILIVLGVLILIALILAFTGAWGKFVNTIRGYSGSEIDNLTKLCQSQCDLDNKNSYCCEEKNLKEEKITCQDERLYHECEINCQDIC